MQPKDASFFDPKAIDLRAASAGTIIFGRKISSITSSAAKHHSIEFDDTLSQRFLNAASARGSVK